MKIAQLDALAVLSMKQRVLKAICRLIFAQDVTHSTQVSKSLLIQADELTDSTKDLLRKHNRNIKNLGNPKDCLVFFADRFYGRIQTS